MDILRRFRSRDISGSYAWDDAPWGDRYDKGPWAARAEGTFDIGNRWVAEYRLAQDTYVTYERSAYGAIGLVAYKVYRAMMSANLSILWALKRLGLLGWRPYQTPRWTHLRWPRRRR